jgi:hypothetical protein
MFFAPIASEPDRDPGADRAERQLRILSRMADIGLSLAEALERRVTAEVDAAVAGEQPSPPAYADPGLVFSRLSRAVRLTFSLETQIAEGELARVVKARAEAATLALARRREAAHRAMQTVADDAERTPLSERQVTIDRVVERTLRNARPGKAEFDAQVRELTERLYDIEAPDDLLARPIGATIALICADLGLEPDWDLWADEDWAYDETRAQAKGSPYADWVIDEEDEDEADEPPSRPPGRPPPH